MRTIQERVAEFIQLSKLLTMHLRHKIFTLETPKGMPMNYQIVIILGRFKITARMLACKPKFEALTGYGIPCSQTSIDNHFCKFLENTFSCRPLW